MSYADLREAMAAAAELDRLRQENAELKRRLAEREALDAMARNLACLRAQKPASHLIGSYLADQVRDAIYGRHSPLFGL